MTIPCASCEMKHSCASDRRCRKPESDEAALREAAVAVHNLRAAIARMADAVTVLERRYRNKNIRGTT